MTSEQRAKKELNYLRAPNQKIAGMAEYRLARVGEVAVPYLSALAKSKRAELRYQVAWSLGLIGTDSVIPILAELARDPDDAVAYDAQYALSKMRSPRAARQVYKIILSNPEAKRYGADLGSSGPYARIFIRRLLKSGDSEIVTRAIYQGAHNRHSRSLIKELLQSDDSGLRRDANDALG